MTNEFKNWVEAITALEDGGLLKAHPCTVERMGDNYYIRSGGNRFHFRTPTDTAMGLVTRGVIKPWVGLRASILKWTDVEPATVVAVTETTMTLRMDKAIKVEPASGFVPGGFCGHFTNPSKWAPVEDPDGVTVKASLRKGGQWKRAGVKTNESGGTVTLGAWIKSYDDNF